EVKPADYQQVDRIRSDSFDPTDTVVLAQSLTVARPTPVVVRGDESTFLDFHEDTNDIRFRVTAAQPSVLVLSQMYYPGWTVQVDGKPAPFLRTDYAFSGTHIDAGTHDVHFTFRPWTFRIGEILS